MDSLPPPKRTFYGPPSDLDVAERPPDPQAPEARKAPEAPTLPAYVTDHQAYVWCRYCCFFHGHGHLDGLRVAHCESWSEPNYEETSYRLETVGLWTRDLAAYNERAKRRARAIAQDYAPHTRGGIDDERRRARWAQHLAIRDTLGAAAQKPSTNGTTT